MPIPSLVAPAFPRWDREVIWPLPTNLVGENYPWNLPIPSWHMSDSNPGVWTSDTQLNRILTGSSAGGGGVAQIQAPASMPALGNHSALPKVAVAANAGAANNFRYGFGGLGFPYREGGAHVPAGSLLPSMFRVFWFRIEIGSNAVTVGNTCRVLLVPVDDGSANPFTPDQLVGPANHGGFGIHGNGAGQWEYCSYNRAGVNLLYEVQALPVHTVTAFNVMDLVIRNGRAGIAAQLDVYWNSAPILSRQFGAGQIEPLTGNEWGYYPVIQAQGSANPERVICSFHARYGRFLPDGTEITS